MATTSAELAASFEFAKRLSDASFRKIIADHGCARDQDVVVTLDTTPVVDVLERIFARCRTPALVAVRRPAVPLGFVFLVAVAGVASPTREQEPSAEPMSEAISIGMLYDSLPATHGTTFSVRKDWRYSLQPVYPSVAAG